MDTARFAPVRTDGFKKISPVAHVVRDKLRISIIIGKMVGFVLRHKANTTYCSSGRNDIIMRTKPPSFACLETFAKWRSNRSHDRTQATKALHSVLLLLKGRYAMQAPLYQQLLFWCYNPSSTSNCISSYHTIDMPLIKSRQSRQAHSDYSQGASKLKSFQLFLGLMRL